MTFNNDFSKSDPNSTNNLKKHSCGEQGFRPGEDVCELCEELLKSRDKGAFMNSNIDFSKVKIGDKLWCISGGDCEVVEIDQKNIRVKYLESDNSKLITFITFDWQGKYYPNHKFPSLFLENPFILKKLDYKDAIIHFARIRSNKIVLSGGEVVLAPKAYVYALVDSLYSNAIFCHKGQYHELTNFPDSSPDFFVCEIIPPKEFLNLLSRLNPALAPSLSQEPPKDILRKLSASNAASHGDDSQLTALTLLMQFTRNMNKLEAERLLRFLFERIVVSPYNNDE